jgi:putative nucleotidyltransferase with HDIG domain
MNRSDAVVLLKQYVHDDNLIKHCLATGAVMKATADYLSEDSSLWEAIGILHDIDFELIGGNMQLHGIKGAAILREHGIDSDIAEIIQRHNHFLHRELYNLPVDIALQAADSISGLVIACALVKGGKISEVSVKTVTKKAKDKAFAAGCDRNRIGLIVSLMELPEFYEIAIMGLVSIRSDLMLS